MFYAELIELLKAEVKPALGCTEPAAVGLAAAQAAAALGGRIDKLTITVSTNVFKNAMAVTIPNTGDAGVALAGALGALIADPQLELELFNNITASLLADARQLVAQGAVTVRIAPETGLYILAQVEGENGHAEACLAGGHTNLAFVRVNGQTVYEGAPAAAPVATNGLEKLQKYRLAELVAAVEAMPAAEIDFLYEGLTMNLEVAAQGLIQAPGLGIGRGLKEMLDKGIIADDIVNRAKIVVGAACDARMAGLDYPVMTTMGSGNQGIVAIVPVGLTAK